MVAIVTAAAPQVRDWPSADGFEIVQLDDSCALTASYPFDGRSPVELTIFYDGGSPSLLLTSMDWSNRDGETYEMTYLLGDVSFSGAATGMVSGYVRKGFGASFEPSFLDSFARARTLLVTRGEVIVTHLNLRSSSAAVATLRRCADYVAKATAEEARRIERWNYIPPDPFAGPPVPGDGNQPTAIVDPTWVRAASPDFPERALSRGITSGTVGLSCSAQANGSLTNCSITSESPAGAGFGQAALRSVSRARLSPRSVDSAAPGARVDFTIRFQAE